MTTNVIITIIVFTFDDHKSNYHHYSIYICGLITIIVFTFDDHKCKYYNGDNCHYNDRIFPVLLATTEDTFKCRGGAGAFKACG